MPTTPDLDAVAAILRRRLPASGYRAYLFGSRATGEARPMSDWDIGLMGPTPITGAVVESIREDLEALPTLHSFDVVDLATAPPALRESALEHGRRLV